MKANAKPELSKKWWTSEKPDDVKGAELEKALQAAERALEDEAKKGDAGSIDTCMAALRDLGGAVDRTTKKELDKKKHKDCITVLEKYDGLIKAELKRLEDAKAKLAAAGEKDEGEEDEEESESKLFEPDYLYKMIKVMRSSGKELKFGFGLNKEMPESSRLLLARKGKPEKLFRALKQTGEFSNRLMMCGYALADPTNAKVLVFRLEEGESEPPQILKLGRRFLRADKNLRFRKLKLVLPNGKTFEDTDPDPEDEGVAATGARAAGATAGDREKFAAELAALEKDLQQFIAEHQFAI
jgi:hypothetical protein